MKRTILVVVSGFAAAAFLIWWMFSSSMGPQEGGQREVSSRKHKDPQVDPPQSRESTLGTFFRVDFSKPENWWRHPIDFYGLVLDESDQPVEEASISMSITDASLSGRSMYSAQSDSVGRFRLTGVRGKNLLISVSKTGYYETPAARAGFQYAGVGEKHLPDPESPVVFRLVRKGQPAALVRVERNFGVSKSGTPLEIDLERGIQAVLGEGHLRIECWTSERDPNGGRGFDWSCRISVPGGGLLERDNAFAFQAPEIGYRAIDEIVMEKNQFGWSSRFSREYFLQLSGGNYARIQIRMIASGDHFIVLESYLNPTGSRNLEYDESLELAPRR